MKKACQYCGGIHDKNYICKSKPQNEKICYKKMRITKNDIFRSSYDWKQKRDEVKLRDKYLCQACYNNFPGTVNRFNTECLSVHHIIPLSVDYNLRLDSGNLITLCETHHEMAESGDIPAKSLLEIIPPRY